MSSVSLQNSISDLLSLESLDEAERATVLVNLSDTIMDGALIKLVQELDEEQVTALEHYLESEPDATTLMQHLVQTYPQFQTLFEEEVVALQTEMQAVLGDTTGDRN